MDQSLPFAIVALEQPHHRGLLPLDGAPEPASPEQADPALGLLLHYRIPNHLRDDVQPGQLVIVPLRGRPTYGVAVELSGSSPVEDTLPITRLVDRKPVLSPAMLALAYWLS